MRSIADRLRSVGSDIAEQDLILYILQGLGSDYESFITAVTTRTDPLTMADLHGLLLTHSLEDRPNVDKRSA